MVGGYPFERAGDAKDNNRLTKMMQVSSLFRPKSQTKFNCLVYCIHVHLSLAACSIYLTRGQIAFCLKLLCIKARLQGKSITHTNYELWLFRYFVGKTCPCLQLNIWNSLDVFSQAAMLVRYWSELWWGSIHRASYLSICLSVYRSKTYIGMLACWMH